MTSYDVLRLVLLIVSGASFVILLNRFRANRKHWNTKTRDYWYALTAWSFASMSANFEGLVRHLEGRYSISLTAAAALVTLSGVLRKGPWGGSDNRKHKGDDDDIV